MSAQTTYEASPAVGFPGMLVDLSTRTIDSGIAETAVQIGYAVKTGTTDAQFVVSDNAADKICGIAVYNTAVENESGDVIYGAKTQFPVIHKGRVWVTAGEVVAKGDMVFYDFTTTPAKYFKTDGGGTRSTVPGMFHSSAGADDLVQVELW